MNINPLTNTFILKRKGYREPKLHKIYIQNIMIFFLENYKRKIGMDRSSIEKGWRKSSNEGFR